MNVQLIEMSEEAAGIKFLECEVYLEKHTSEQIAAARKGYEQQMLGRPLLNLSDVMRDCPLGDDSLPKLAVARADRFQVELSVPKATKTGPVRFMSYAKNTGWSSSMAISPTLTKHFLMPQIPERDDYMRLERYALVPMIPAEVRNEPHVSATLKKYHILWEVEEWSETPHGVIPDRDPLLLEHLLGDLYVVQGAWDLTDLERAIMSNES